MKAHCLKEGSAIIYIVVQIQNQNGRPFNKNWRSNQIIHGRTWPNLWDPLVSFLSLKPNNHGLNVGCKLTSLILRLRPQVSIQLLALINQWLTSLDHEFFSDLHQYFFLTYGKPCCCSFMEIWPWQNSIVAYISRWVSGRVWSLGICIPILPDLHSQR